MVSEYAGEEEIWYVFGNHLDDFLQHGLGDVDEEEGVCAVGGDADKLVTVVVGRQQVHL